MAEHIIYSSVIDMSLLQFAPDSTRTAQPKKARKKELRWRKNELEHGEHE